ncbi:hypothetical protein GCM10010421_29130 [Streptomyces glaucus]|uniref:N-acetyltransferase domain-containing protein n=1 Tax=Streptomyces glaucus TaxID=284029 RepID=A0ABN3JRK8_9ACTN
MPCLTGPVLPVGTLARTPQPALRTGDGLLLRPWTARDAPAVHEIFQDPVLRRWHIRAAASPSGRRCHAADAPGCSCSASMRAFHSRLEACQPSSL